MLSGPDWKHVVPSDPNIPPYFVFTKPIEKSPRDEREYRIIQLDNGLKATLVHDSETDKAAASLDVAVGHLADPPDMPGLAHFCEHLLFMGTEQFPRENDYQEYLSKNNGGSNAYTSTTNTNYYFNVTTSALIGALERFSGFFHSPLFAASCTSRELNAVDSENKKNHQADVWRIFQLNKHLSKPGHVWSKFGTGNRDSLSKVARELKAQGKLNGAILSNGSDLSASVASDRIPSPAPSETEADGGVVGREIRRRLMEWWTEEYCAGRMNLCILGKESLEELSDLASKLFSSVPNRGKDSLPMINDNPFGPNEKGTLVSVQTIMDFHALEISFPLEYQPPLWRFKPASFLSHFVGHEGPGSLHSYLKNKGWIISLSSGPQSLARAFAMFKITIYLTEEGFKNYRSVILAAFKYLALLRSSRFENYHQKEIAALSSIRFQFSEKKRPDTYATWISEHMNWPVPSELVLSGPQLAWEWDINEATPGGEDTIRQYLDTFRIQEGRVVLMAKGDEHNKVHPGMKWEKEPWYDTDYNVKRFEEEFVKDAQAPSDIPELFLPGPNAFIPNNLDVDKRQVSEPFKRPHLIRQTPLTTLWHKKDDRFWVPKAFVMLDIRSPASYASPRAAVLTRLYTDLVNDALTEFAYDADLAGLSYHFSNTTTGLYVYTGGYNDKLATLIKDVLRKARGLKAKPDRLAVAREWRNFFLGQSYSISDYFGRYLLSERQWTVEEELKELPSVTVEEIDAHAKKLFSEVHLRMLVTGNLYKDEALGIADIAEEGLKPTSLSQAQLNDRALIIPPASNYIWSLPLPNPNQANSALTYYLHYGPVADKHLRVTAALLTQILSEPAFAVLRTQEQLGYIVSCSSWNLSGSSERGLRIVVQSEKMPGYLEQRVEAFLTSMKSKLGEMSRDEFEEHKTGLKKKWLEADKNLAEESSRFQTYVTSGHWDFLRRYDDAELLHSITKDDVLKLFGTHIDPQSPTRAKVSVHMVSKKPRIKRVSEAASQAFEEKLRSSGINASEHNWKQRFQDGLPLLTEFTQFWQGALAGREDSERLLGEIPKLVTEHSIEGEDIDPTHLNATYIKDALEFRWSLSASVDPGPMAQWGDLPTPRF
ncbi:insulin-degrading enzyme [Macrolepiota fuliginosa MF-IS2]|uniref:Insulin-degrading enzyme n=1 Tax=Macrolepiota fuliginosa MF-IS2 TaxID=1400762 RepID=A0A9P5XS09_9AGAR|nr:insulin-degrading enzyme [Macrolepiota fuliginosa MF-IS2]